MGPFFMNTSTYQLLKIHVLRFFSLSHDAAHIYVGFLTYLVTILYLKGKKPGWKALIPCFVVSIVMELFDLRDHYAVYADFRPMSHLHDIINTNFIPFLLVLVAHFTTKKSFNVS